MMRLTTSSAEYPEPKTKSELRLALKTGGRVSVTGFSSYGEYMAFLYRFPLYVRVIPETVGEEDGEPEAAFFVEALWHKDGSLNVGGSKRLETFMELVPDLINE